MQDVTTRWGRFAIDEKSDAKMLKLLSERTYPHEALLRIAGAYAAQGIALDVGAHIGTVSVPLSGIAKRVIAYEANPQTFEYLKRNVAANNATNVDARNVGLAELPGRASAAVINARNAGANTLVAGNDIRVSTLDAEVEEADFIKIDVEGMELAVLKGGGDLIVRSRPAVWLEVNLTQLRMHKTRISELDAWLYAHGYDLYLPLFDGNTMTLGRIKNLPLITFLVTPRAYLFGGNCASFDILALPREAPLRFSTRAVMHMLLSLFYKHITQKIHRIFRL